MSIRMGSTDMDILVDTGAKVSLLSKIVYDEVPAVSGSPLHPVDRQIAAANGGLIKVYGMLEMTFVIERVPYVCDFLVADMGHLSGLLGMDFLKRHKATLMCSTGTVRLGGVEINCREGPTGQGGRAVVNESICLPARHTSWSPLTW